MFGHSLCLHLFFPKYISVVRSWVDVMHLAQRRFYLKMELTLLYTPWAYFPYLTEHNFLTDFQNRVMNSGSRKH